MSLRRRDATVTMQMPERVNSATATLLPPVVLPSPAMASMAGPAELPLRPPSLPEQASPWCRLLFLFTPGMTLCWVV